MIRERTSVAKIGRKSLGCAGPIVWDTGQILAFFHCVGTMDVLNDKLTRSARVLLNVEHQDARTTQAGRLDQ